MKYPRDYAVPNWDINTGTAFVIMPINPDFDMALGLIVEVCESLDIKAQRGDDITKQDYIMANILEGIAKSEIIIVDITGSNPNVFYELGIAHTLRAKHSVIIITQEEDIPKATPFDIRHWSILQYKNNNKSKFKAELRERISECRKLIDSDEFITRLLKSYTFENGLIRQFIEVAKQISVTNMELSCSILSGSASTQLCNRDKILELDIYLTTLGDYRDGEFQKIVWLLKYLIYTSDFVLSQYIDTIKTKFMKEWRRDSIQIGNIGYWELVANICCKIIEKKHKDKSDAIEWLTKYLGNARMGRIDKVRTKIEDFMLTVQDEDVDKAVVNMLIGKSRTAKESAVDICGQKPIFESVNNILQIIQNNESDPHIMRSSINALARMNVSIAAPAILKWMQTNRDKWGEQAVSSSLMSVAEKALQVLDENSYKELITLKDV
jgi:hypothetical protein